jgi:hypothetical protein
LKYAGDLSSFLDWLLPQKLQRGQTSGSSMAPNYSLFYGVEGTTFAIAVICFSLRLSNRYLKKICTLVSIIFKFGTSVY